MWHSGLEVSSYSWSKQQLGQGAEIVTGAERLPGERSDLGIPSEDPGPVFFLSTPSFFFFFPPFWTVAARGGGLDAHLWPAYRSGPEV